MNTLKRTKHQQNLPLSAAMRDLGSNNNKQQGFTLIELMVTVAIVSILAAIAIPSYKDYTRRSRFSAITMAAGPYKSSVTECFYYTADVTECDSGVEGVMPALTAADGDPKIQSADITAGVITIVPNNNNGITSNDTLTLTPNPNATTGRLDWQYGSGALTKGYVKN